MARWLRTLAAVASLAIAGTLWWALPPARDEVDTVDEEALAENLSPAALPLSAAETDVILVIGCTLRRDRIGAYGGQDTTPFVDRLAGAGSLFERNYAQTSWTRPSTGAILTGRWPRPLHLDNPGKKGSLSLVLNDSFVTLAESFQQAGYHTVGAVSNPNARSVFGFSQGFDIYDEPGGRYRRGAEIPSGDELVDRVLGELKVTPAEQRFFGELLFTTTHQPRPRFNRYTILFRDLGSRLRGYDAALRALDGQLARLYVGAKARRKNLLFVLAADHGEGLRRPTHHGKGHGNYLYPSTIQVPLIYQHPALPPGGRIGGMSMNIDILPTILGLLGISPLAPVDGRSQADALRHLRPDAVHERVFAETYYKRTKKTTLIEADWQLVHDLRRKRIRLYASSDPDATRDRSAEEPAVAARMLHTLGQWEDEMNTIAAAGSAIEVKPDADTSAMLKQLGYVDEEE